MNLVPPTRRSSFQALRATLLAVGGLWTFNCVAAPPPESPPGERSPTEREPSERAPTERAPTARRHSSKAAPRKLDLTGRKRVGQASVYDLESRKMADGTPMNPQSNNAASKTLPLGTEAKVTNLDTGKTAVVTIRDRGPYVPGRIVDLSPATAKKIGLSQKQGVAKVTVAPITVPLPDGGVKAGEATATGNPRPR